MILSKSNILKVVFISFSLIPAIASPTTVSAQDKSSNWVAATWQRLTSRPTRQQRPSTLSRGGGNRDLCPYTQEKLTAIVPVTAKGISYLEKTISERPTFRFYVPYDVNAGLQAEFILKDTDEKPVYKTMFPLKSTPGIINISLSKGQELKVKQRYRWVFSVICNPDNRSGDATVNGWIQRVSDKEVLTADPAKVPDKERLNIYANSLLWFDMLDTLFALQRAYPAETEYRTIWKLLLKEVGLSDDAISQSLNSQ